MRACSVSEQDFHIPLDRRTFLQWLSRWWRGQHESGSPSFSINRCPPKAEVVSSNLAGRASESIALREGLVLRRERSYHIATKRHRHPSKGRNLRPQRAPYPF
jgi:hypothetical protein